MVLINKPENGARVVCADTLRFGNKVAQLI